MKTFLKPTLVLLVAAGMLGTLGCGGRATAASSHSDELTVIGHWEGTHWGVWILKDPRTQTVIAVNSEGGVIQLEVQ